MYCKENGDGNKWQKSFLMIIVLIKYYFLKMERFYTNGKECRRKHIKKKQKRFESA